MDNIFTSNGRINTDIDPMTIHPDRRAQYVALAEAHKECERADADQRAADLAVAEAVHIHDAAQTALPRTTFLEEWRRSRG
jgi:hypothetical protein